MASTMACSPALRSALKRGIRPECHQGKAQPQARHGGNHNSGQLKTAVAYYKGEEGLAIAQVAEVSGRAAEHQAVVQQQQQAAHTQ